MVATVSVREEATARLARLVADALGAGKVEVTVDGAVAPEPVLVVAARVAELAGAAGAAAAPETLPTEVSELLAGQQEGVRKLTPEELRRLDLYLYPRGLVVGRSVGPVDLTLYAAAAEALASAEGEATSQDSLPNVYRWLDFVRVTADLGALFPPVSLVRAAYVPPPPAPLVEKKKGAAEGAKKGGVAAPEGAKKGGVAAPDGAKKGAGAEGAKKGAGAGAEGAKKGAGAGAEGAKKGAGAGAEGAKKGGAEASPSGEAASASLEALEAELAALDLSQPGAKAKAKKLSKEISKLAKSQGSDGTSKGKSGPEGGASGAPKAAPAPTASSEPTVDALDLVVGRIVEVERHPNAESLYVERIDLGEEGGPRTIVSGLVKFCSEEELRGRLVVVVANLKPAKMRDVLSAGMVLCSSDEAHEAVDPVRPPVAAVPGDRVRAAGYDAAPEPVLPPKKKIFEKIAPALVSDADGICRYKELALEVLGKGPCLTTVFNGHLA